MCIVPPVSAGVGPPRTPGGPGVTNLKTHTPKILNIVLPDNLAESLENNVVQESKAESAGVEDFLSKWVPEGVESAPPKSESKAKPPAEEPFDIEAEIREIRAELIELRQEEVKKGREGLQIKRAPTARKRLSEFVREAWSVHHPGVALYWGKHLDVICDHVQCLVESLLRSRKDPDYVMPDHNLVINVPPRSLKPCHNAGMVIEKVRGLIQLGDVQVGDSVLTHRGRFRRVDAVHEQGNLALVRLKTHRGRIVDVAGSHPMLTQRGWIRADEITTDDVLAEVFASECSGSETITREEARFIGYLIGDGCLSTGVAAKFTNQDRETLADFKHCAKTLGFRTVETTSRSRAFDVAVKDPAGSRTKRSRGTCGPLRQWVRDRGLEGSSSYTKRVPDVIMRGSEDIISEYLAAYWSCDGTIQYRTDLQGRSSECFTVKISATTVSEGLVRDHLALMNRIGLPFRIRRKENHKLQSKRQGSTYVSWDLVASTQDTAAKFLQLVGSRIRHEKKTRVVGLQRTKFDSTLMADPVVAIERPGEGPCRCLTVYEDHSFSYQGVAVHNTEILGVYLPAWLWLQDPTLTIRYMSVVDDVRKKASKDNRDLLESKWYKQTFDVKWKIRDDADNIGLAQNTERGRLSYSTYAQKIVGQGSDIIIVDDPLDSNEANSDIIRTGTNERWDTGISNRVNDPKRCIRIGIMQRLHEDDWSGHVLSQGDWRHICLPMEFELKRSCKCADCQSGQSLLGPYEWRTVDGELMHSDRFGPAEVETEKKKGSYRYAGQYQQRPAPLEGGVIKRKWFGQFDPGILPTFRRTIIFVDCALKKNDFGSRTAMAVIAELNNHRYILDMFVDRIDPPDMVRQAKRLREKYPKSKIVIESKASGDGMIAQLKVDGLTGVEPWDPKNEDKMSRIMSVIGIVEAGDVLLPIGAPWVDDFLHELSVFPNGKNDDQVDVLSMGLSYIRGNVALQSLKV